MNRKFDVRLALLAFLCCLMIGVSPVAAEERMAKDGDVVEIHYTGKLEDKTVFDSSEKRDPLKFTLGEKGIIPGMNNAVLGMKPGESKTVTIPPDQAYGSYNKELIFEVPTKNLPPGSTPGTPLRNPQGHMVVVKEVKGEQSILDANHPLAGKTLIFEINLVSIQ